MRIAIVNYYDWLVGGMEKVALTHYEQLQAMGHEVAFFANAHPNNLKTAYRRYYPNEPDRQYYQVQWKNLHQLPATLMRSFNNQDVAKKMSVFLDLFKPDLVHTHGIPRAFTPSLYDPVLERGLPLVQTHHYVKLICPTSRLLKGDKSYCHEMPCISGGFPMSCIQHRCQQGSLLRSIISSLELGLNRKNYREKPSLHLAPSQYLKDLLDKAGVPASKLVLHPNFVNTETFFPASQKAPGEYFLYFGRLSNEKGLSVLLDAFAPLVHSQLIIAGSGPLEGMVQERIRREGLTHICCLGQQDEEQLVPLIQGARATILPSLWGEIFGLSILESMACARPVIGSSVGAIPELIEHDGNGWLVPPGEAEALRTMVRRVNAMEKSQILMMGLAGLRMVREQYTLKHHMSRLQEIYEMLCNRTPSKVLVGSRA